MKRANMLILSVLLVISVVLSVGIFALGARADSDEKTADETEGANVEMYALAPENQSLMQSYVVKTKNGKLIVMDGGIDGAGAGFPDAGAERHLRHEHGHPRIGADLLQPRRSGRGGDAAARVQLHPQRDRLAEGDALQPHGGALRPPRRQRTSDGRLSRLAVPAPVRLP